MIYLNTAEHTTPAGAEARSRRHHDTCGRHFFRGSHRVILSGSATRASSELSRAFEYTSNAGAMYEDGQLELRDYRNNKSLEPYLRKDCTQSTKFGATLKNVFHQKTVHFFPNVVDRRRLVHSSSYARSNESPDRRSLALNLPCLRDPADFSQRVRRRQALDNLRLASSNNASNAPDHVCSGRFFEHINLLLIPALVILSPDICKISLSGYHSCIGSAPSSLDPSHAMTTTSVRPPVCSMELGGSGLAGARHLRDEREKRRRARRTRQAFGRGEGVRVASSASDSPSPGLGYADGAAAGGGRWGSPRAPRVSPRQRRRVEDTHAYLCAKVDPVMSGLILALVEGRPKNIRQAALDHLLSQKGRGGDRTGMTAGGTACLLYTSPSPRD